MHGFLTMVGILPASERAIDDIAEAISCELARLSNGRSHRDPTTSG